ncbi:cupin domain-containing protein [Vibrio sp. DW001]|uniref:cupin domain-containing protein n=1 Tax=Vibrio sp. DW001 TaxID=2912315 RepID=UPI0023B0CA35|nr:cupin domain-containing protein [Vibrio sp. DW001]WED29668.1 cupin domain-containing protein [Vibrio sp. DW001]
METKVITTNIANRATYYTARTVNTAEIEWVEHPTYSGIYLKKVINSAATNGLLSYHLVKIPPNFSFKNHRYINQIELHEVIEGSGLCVLNKESVTYHLGTMAVIPRGKEHMILAGDDGLILLVKIITTTF